MSTSNTESEATPNVTQGNRRPRKPLQPPICRKYRTSGRCPKGDACLFTHVDPRPGGGPAKTISQPQTPPIETEDVAKIPPEVPVSGLKTNASSPATTPSTNDAPGNPSSDRPERKSNKKPNKKGKGKGKGPVSPEEVPVKEQALAQSTPAKAENAKRITIYADDDEQTWTLDRGFLSQHSEPLSLVLSYSGKQADAGIKDPLKEIRGLTRFSDGAGSLQLDDVKEKEFDIFLDGLRETKDTTRSAGDLKIILTLASDWGFEDLRNRTMREVEKLHLSPVERTVLARRCKIAKWIHGAVLSLTIVLDPLDAQDMHILGATTAAAVWRAREGIIKHQLLPTKDRSTQQTKCPDATCKQVIREVMLRILERPGTAGKLKAEMASMLGKDISAGEMEDLCAVCASDAGLKSATSGVAEEVQVARTILDDTLGKTDAQWLEPA